MESLNASYSMSSLSELVDYNPLYFAALCELAAENMRDDAEHARESATVVERFRKAWSQRGGAYREVKDDLVRRFLERTR